MSVSEIQPRLSRLQEGPKQARITRSEARVWRSTASQKGNFGMIRCSRPELRPVKYKKARRNGLFCSKWVAGGCLRSWNRFGVLQGACLGRSRFGDTIATIRAGDGHRGAHLAGQVIHQGAERVRWVAELGLP
jgi:hypothetical protein